ncbi:MAG: DUF2442 domain-containing protein [Hyphomicrobiales bacterium]
MTDLLRIVSAEPVIHGVLKIVWNDGYEGVVDFRHFLAIGKVYTPLREPEFFKTVRVEPYGHSIEWLTPEGREIDFGSDSLQELAKRQARLLLAS